MSKNFDEKVVKVGEIAEMFKSAYSVVLINYRGLTVEEVTGLRKQFRDAGVNYVVLKNTLIKRATDSLGIEGLDPFLTGPTAVAFGAQDPVAPAKVIVEFIKKAKKAEVKCGLMDGKLIDTAAVTALAELPPKEVLIARMMGSLNSPITGFVGVLSATLRSLVYAVDAVRKQKAVE